MSRRRTYIQSSSRPGPSTDVFLVMDPPSIEKSAGLEVESSSQPTRQGTPASRMGARHVQLGHRAVRGWAKEVGDVARDDRYRSQVLGLGHIVDRRDPVERPWVEDLKSVGAGEDSDGERGDES